MGWIKYCVVPSWQMKFQLSRHTNDLLDSTVNSLDELLGSDYEVSYYDIREKKFEELTAGDFQDLMQCAKICSDIACASSGDMLLYWLKTCEIGYLILSEGSERLEDEFKDYKKVGPWMGEENEEELQS